MGELFAGKWRMVAGFLSQRKSNREIAGALVLSEQTVEHHTGNIRTKLSRLFTEWTAEAVTTQYRPVSDMAIMR